MGGGIEVFEHKRCYPIPMEEESHKLKTEDMKDVACLIFSTPTTLRQCSFTLYLLHMTRQKVIAFLDLNEDYPSKIGFLVYKSMLYMFGGRDRRTGVQLADAYVLDLFQLAKTTPNHHKPSPTKLPPMNFGKCDPIVLLVRNKICVFDTHVGDESSTCHFELYDPDQNTWTMVPDPCSFTTACFVDAHYVKDDKLFIYIRNKQGVFVLDIGSATSPSWSHLDLIYNLHDTLFAESEGVMFGSWLVCLDEVYDLGNKRFFAQPRGPVVWIDKTDTQPYDVSHEFDAKIFGLGSDRVCSIETAIIYKPQQRMGKIKNVKMNNTSPMFKQQCLIRKCERRRKGSLRFIVKVGRVDGTKVGPGMHVEVLQSFTLPMYKDNSKLKSFTVPQYPSKYDDYDYGDIRMVSLCHL